MLNISEQEKRRILTLHMLAEQKYAENSVNVGGKIIPISKTTSDIYYAIYDGGYKKILSSIRNIKKIEDLNLVLDEFTNIIKKDLGSSIQKKLIGETPKDRENSMGLVTAIKNHLTNMADVTWTTSNIGQPYKLKITSKNPNTKADTRSVEQKRDDDIAEKNKRFEHIKSIFCYVKNGIIVNPSSQFNGKPYSEWFAQAKPTTQELNAAKEFCKGSELAQPKQQPTQVQWTKETFPLRFMMKGPNVGKLQQALGIKPTNQFYTKTEAKVNTKMKELGLTYNRKTGIDPTTFNKIISTKGSTPQDIAGQTVKNWAQNLQKTDNLPTPEEFEKKQ
jgi:hypothetical protein